MEYLYNADWNQIFKASMVLFAVIDIVGSIPIIIKLKEQSGEIHALRTSLVSFFIMVSFLIVGEGILNLFGVNVEAFAVAGSLILFAMSLEMILGITLFKDEVSGKTASIVPLAFPIIAGAGTLTTLLSLRAEYELINVILAIIINSLFVYIILKSSNRIEKLLGKNGIGIIRRVFGIILLSISVKLFSTNISLIV